VKRNAEFKPIAQQIRLAALLMFRGYVDPFFAAGELRNAGAM
jgi:hypothetical protein